MIFQTTTSYGAFFSIQSCITMGKAIDIGIVLDYEQRPRRPKEGKDLKVVDE